MNTQPIPPFPHKKRSLPIKKIGHYLLLFCLLTSLNACGVKGPLYLSTTPEKPKSREISTFDTDTPLFLDEDDDTTPIDE
jgi:predicted small lipoprotein YifL